MPNTFSAESLFGGGGPARNVNPPQGTARETVPGGPSTVRGTMPVLPGVSTALGISVPMLVALGVMAWFLFRTY